MNKCLSAEILVSTILIVLLFQAMVVFSQEAELDPVALTENVWSIEWNPIGTKIAMGIGPSQCENFANSYAIVIVDAITLQEINRVGDSNYCSITNMDWKPNSDILVGGGYGTASYIWDINTGYTSQIIAPRVFSGYLDNLWNPDGIRIASADSDAIIWDASTGEILISLATNSPSSLTWDPDGTSLATSNGDISIWDANTGSLLQTIPSSNAGELTWSPDGTKIAGSEENNIVIWDIATGTSLYSFEGHSDYITEVVWRLDGQALASSSYDGTVRVWNSLTGEQAGIFSYSGQVYALDWSPDGQYLAFGGRRNNGQNASIQLENLASLPLPTPQVLNND